MKTLKCLVLSLLLLAAIGPVAAQLKVGDNPTSIHPSSVLELESANKGLLLTRLADTAAINSLNPPDGMLVYFTPGNMILVRSQNSWKVLVDNRLLTQILATKQDSLITGNVSSTDLNIIGGNGAVIGTGVNLGLKKVNNSIGTFGSSTTIPQFTVNDKGLLTSVNITPITFPVTLVNGQAGTVTLGVTDLNDVVLNALTNRDLLQFDGTNWVNVASGNVTSADLTVTGGNNAVIGTGVNLSLPTVNTTTGTFGSPIAIPQVTVNGKGLVTNITATPIVFPVTMVNGQTGAVTLGINNLNNVTITAPVNKDILQFDGANWVNVPVDSITGGGGSGGVDTFTTDIKVTALNGLGKYGTNSTIPAIGKTARQVLLDALDQTVGPTYTPPTVSINSAPPAGIVEIGSNLSVNLSSLFSQNDAGPATSTVYYLGSSALPGASSTVNNITAPATYKVTVNYSQGGCKLDNHGVTDCNGRINAGSVTSGTITFSPTPKRYWGRCTGTPNAATIIAAAGGGSELNNSRNKSGFAITASGSNNIFYAYPSSLGDLTAISVGGFDSFLAFTKYTVSFTNASGYTQNYNVYVSNNTLSGDATNINIQ